MRGGIEGRGKMEWGGGSLLKSNVDLNPIKSNTRGEKSIKRYQFNLLQKF